MRHFLRPALALALFLPLAGCGSEPRRTHEGLHAVLWMQTSGEYHAACATAYATARDRFDRALADPAATAALEQGGDLKGLPPAVVLDVDETALDNSHFQAELTATATTFTPAAFGDWCRQEKCPAVPGAAEFCRYAFEKGATVVFITNRDASVEDATRRNLAAAGFPDHPERVLVIGKSGESDKGPRRRRICERYRVVLLVGDQLQDFLSIPKGTDGEGRRRLAQEHAARWGAGWIALPNPSYGDWERALVDPKGTDAANLERKFGALRR